MALRQKYVYKYHPYTTSKSTFNYLVPSTPAEDFKNFLHYDIPGYVMNMEVIHDWYEQYNDGYEKKYERGMIYEDSTKSRYSDTDNTGLNVSFMKGADVVNGDYIIDENGVIYLLNWEFAPNFIDINTRPVRCNTMLQFLRHKELETDYYGHVIEEAGWHIIADSIPANAYRYDGRPLYSANSGGAGIVPTALTKLSIQLNDTTRQINIDDRFIWYNQLFEVIDINPTNVSLSGCHGTILIQAKQVSGGIKDGYQKTVSQEDESHDVVQLTGDRYGY